MSFVAFLWGIIQTKENIVADSCPIGVPADLCPAGAP